MRDAFHGPARILLHERDAVDLAPLRETGSVLFNHDISSIVGRPENVEIDTKDRVGRATIRFDQDDESERVFQKVKSGSLRGVSVRFAVSESNLAALSDSSTDTQETRRQSRIR